MRQYLSNLLVFLCLSTSIPAQQVWQRHYGGNGDEELTDIISTSDGGFLVVGATTSYGNVAGTGTFGNSFHAYMVKTDSIGKMEWQQVWDTAGYTKAISVTQNSAGDYFVTGETGTSSLRDIFILKLNPQGSIAWVKCYGGTNDDYPSGIEDSGTDLVISGTTNSFGQGLTDIYLFKVDSSGTQIWSKTIGSLVGEFSSGLSKVHDGGFLICGKYQTPSYKTGFAVRTDSDGDSVWTKIINIGNSSIVNYYVCTELEGDSLFILAGEGGSGAGTYYVTRLDMNGNVLNHYTQSGYYKFAAGITPTFDGGFVVVGNSFIKFNHKAAVEWEDDYLWAWRVLQLPDSGYVLGGYIRNPYPPVNADWQLSKTNSLGFAVNLPLIPMQANPPLPYCYGSTVELTVPEGYDSYQWFRQIDYGLDFLPVSNDTIVVDTSGTYYCIATSGNEYFSTDYVSFIIPDELEANLNYSGSISFCHSDTTITLWVDYVPGGSYQWYLDGLPIPGATDRDWVPIVPGSYHMVITHFACGWVSSDTLQINTNAGPDLILSPDSGSVNYYPGTGVLCDSVLLNVIHHTGYQYQWHHDGIALNSFSNNFYASAPGSYYSVVSNSCAIDTTQTITIVADTMLSSINVNGPLSGCGTAYVTLAVPLDSIYTYQWFRNGIGISNYNHVHHPNSVGIYFCRVNVHCGGSVYTFDSDSVNYSYISKSAPNLSYQGQNGDPIFCSNDSLRLYINTILNATYQWFLDSIPITGADSTEYYATASGFYHCEAYLPGCDPLISFRLFVRQGPPVATITTDQTQLCPFGNGYYRHFEIETPDYLNGAVTIQWNKDGVPISGANSVSLLNVNQPGVYDCTLSNICGTITTNAITLFAAPNDVSVTASIPGNYFCSGDTITLTATSIPGYTYQWYRNGQAIPLSNGTIISTTQEGQYGLQYNNGICLMTTEYFLYQTSFVSANIFSQTPVQSCNPAPVILEANTRNDFTYQWIKDNLPVPGATQSTYIPQSSGEYKFIIHDSLGCEYTSLPKQVDSNVFEDFTIYTSTGTTVACNGDSITLFAGINSPSYQWFINNNLIPGANGFSLTIADEGLYKVAVTDGAGCFGESSLVIGTGTFLPLNYPVITHDVCNNSLGSITLSSTVVLHYLWSNGATTPAISNLISGNYTATMIDYLGCSGTQIYTVLDLDSIPVTIAGTTIKCEGQTIQVYVPGSFAGYLWSTGDTTNYMYPTTSGIYTVTVTNANGCTGSDTVAVTFLPLPVINIIPDGPTAFCLGDSLKLSTDTGLTGHKWFRFGVQIPNALDSFIYVKSRGVYTCRATDSNNCSDTSAGILITIPCIPPRDPEEKPLTGDEIRDVVIYPNPSTGSFFVRFDQVMKDGDVIKIFDVTGRKINFSLYQVSEHLLHLEGLQPGIFLFYFESGSGEFNKMIKLVKTE